MTPRAKTPAKPALLIQPPITCQVTGCPETYDCIGTYATTYRAALLGGWSYRCGQALCPGHRDWIPWWPPGASLAVIENVPRPGLGAQGEPATADLSLGRANTGPGDLGIPPSITVVLPAIPPAEAPPLQPLPEDTASFERLDQTQPFIPPQFTEFAAEMQRLDEQDTP
jgi:hypothetical protein